MSENLVADNSPYASDHLEGACLEALRVELGRSFPAIDVRALYKVLRTFGRKTFPPGMLLPAGQERKALRAATRPHARGEASSGLFSSAFYSLANPDVAATGISPWLHYQVFGRNEGRSPHPLVDIGYLEVIGEGRNPGELLDRYLADPKQWLSEIGPYVECRRFALSGHWNGIESPFSQIVREHVESHWVHRRLMLVDSTSAEKVSATLSASAFLLTANGGRTQISQLHHWIDDPADVGSQSEPFVVVPGFFIGRGGHALSVISTEVLSPDSTYVRLDHESMTASSGFVGSCTQLVHMAGWVSRTRLSELVSEAPSGTRFAPYSRAQETSLRQLRRDLRRESSVEVLEWGNQSRLIATALVQQERERFPEISTANLRVTSDASSIAIVLPVACRRATNADSEIRALLVAGASLCLVDGALNSWLPIIQSRRLVFTHESLVEDVASFIDVQRISTLPRLEGFAV